MGGAQSARNLVVAGVGDRRSHRGHRHQRAEHSRNRHHQPARDDNRVGPRNGGTGLQRHRMAGPPDLGVLRLAEGRRKNRVDSRKDGPDHRRLFQRHEDQMDSGQRAGRAGAGREGQADVRNGRHMADLAADARRSARDGRDQRLAHDAVQHPHGCNGTRSCWSCSTSRRQMLPEVRSSSCRFTERRRPAIFGHEDPHRGHRRATSRRRCSARCCFEPGIGEKHLRHGLLPADEHAARSRSLSKNDLHDDHRLAARRQGRTLRPRRAASSSAGAVVQWLRDGMGLIRSLVGDRRRVASSVPDTGRRLLRARASRAWRAPHWDHVRPGHDQRASARGTTRCAHSPRGAGGHRLPDAGHRAARCSATPASRWCELQRRRRRRRATTC